MDPETPQLKLESRANVGAFYSARVMRPVEVAPDGTVIRAEPVSEWSDPVHNLILPAGFNPDNSWSRGNIGNRFHAGTGTTPNSVILDGTFAQAGTTVTRSSGTGVFVSGNVNDFIKFASGERAKITAFTNSTTVTVDRAQTVAAAALTVYDTSRLGLDTWVAETTTDDATVGFEGFTNDADAGTIRYWFTKNFAVEVTAKTYTEVGAAGGGAGGSGQSLFSRAVLDTPVNVDVGQFLQLRVDLVMTMGNCRVGTPLTMNISGWPYPYTITDIVSNGTYWEATTSINHHFASGRPITISGALPVAVAVSSISSTATTITVNTAAAHGKSNGDSIVLAGVTPSGYNGTWTIANVVDSDTYEITSPINLGAGSGGTSRLATPGTWYNGTHTISAVPATNKIRIANVNNVPQAGSGTMVNNQNASAQAVGWAFNQITNNFNGFTIFEPAHNGLNCYVIPEASLKTGLAYGTTTTITGNIGEAACVRGAYNASTRTRVWTLTYGSAAVVGTTIRQIMFGGGSGLIITFEERQRKDNGYQLALTYSISWEPDLV